MSRTAGSKNLATLEYVMLYDRLCQQYGDPVEAMFKICFGRYKVDHRLRAAQNLASRRYPQIQPVRIESDDTQREITFSWREINDDDHDPLHSEKMAGESTPLN